MKRVWLILAVLAAVLVGYPAHAADAVGVESITNMVNIRGESEATLSGTYFRSSTLLLTNALCLVGTTGSDTQGLDGVTVTLTVGNSSSNIDYTATAYTNSAGVTNLWWASITVLDISGTVNLQTKLVDANTNTFIYPWKRLSVKDAL